MDTTTPLNQLEAGRLRTEAEDRHGKKLKYRQLIGYSPEQIAARYGFRARDVAEMAGRENGKVRGKGE